MFHDILTLKSFFLNSTFQEKKNRNRAHAGKEKKRRRSIARVKTQVLAVFSVKYQIYPLVKFGNAAAPEVIVSYSIFVFGYVLNPFLF